MRCNIGSQIAAAHHETCLGVALAQHTQLPLVPRLVTHCPEDVDSEGLAGAEAHLAQLVGEVVSEGTKESVLGIERNDPALGQVLRKTARRGAVLGGVRAIDNLGARGRRAQRILRGFGRRRSSDGSVRSRLDGHDACENKGQGKVAT